MSIYATNGTTWTYSGMILPAERGERPKETDEKKLIETRAVQLQDGWVGQIIMAGEIVKQTPPKDKPEDALEEVNAHILKRFKRMIVG